jgi:DNA polymerase III subunit alpha
MPDVDIDFCPERREEVIQYVTEKYGSDKVCQIITFGTLAARNAIKGVARVMDYPFAESNKISKMIEMGKSIKESLDEVEDFKKLYAENALVKEIVDYAIQLEGLKNNIGVHAAGVIIARDPLSDLVPIQNSKEGGVITEFAMGDLEKLGLLKMDFLGLRNLTIIKNTLKMVKKRHNVEIDINNIPLDDAKTYELLCNGQTDGVFQLESSGMKALVKRLKPSTFEDIGALVALYRPGPLDSGMVDDFVDRKHGRQQVSYPHPSLKPILEDTYGTIVYQEQIMQIAQVLAGYSLGEADLLRRAMGKKKKEVMDEQRGVFVTKCIAKGTDEKIATELFDSMEKFAAYCFNRAHSAAYAFIAYQTAYLKAHYPVEYLSALLSSVSDNQDKIQAYIAEGQKMDIKVLAPDINKSFADFYPDENNIRFGLASIKNVGMSVIDEIIKAREEKLFDGFYDFCLKVDPKALNKRTLESLIKAGAFCELEKNRKQLVENLDSIVSAAQKEHERKISGQIGLFGMMGDDSSPVTFSINPDGEEFTDGEIQHFEKELLGFYITSHPLESIRDKLPFLTTHRTIDLAEIKDGSYVTVCGLISYVRLISTKNGKLLKVGTIEDLHGNVEFVAFQETLNNYNSFIEPEQKVIISGKVQMRGDDEGATVNLVVDTVKPVDNCNIIDILMNEKPTFEMLMAMKDFLAQNNGSDPVIFNIKNNGKPTKILLNSKFWVNTTNDFINGFKNNFENVEISMRSLDSKEENSKEIITI